MNFPLFRIVFGAAIGCGFVPVYFKPGRQVAKPRPHGFLPCKLTHETSLMFEMQVHGMFMGAIAPSFSESRHVVSVKILSVLDSTNPQLFILTIRGLYSP
jgi:hypothetical protein